MIPIDSFYLRLQLEDKVWVRTGKEIWCSGKICRKGFRVGQTRVSRTNKGFYYHVQFGSRMHLRKFFAPMNGEIKPNTEAVRQILEQEGWIGEAGSGTDSSGDLYSD
ncbi:hypothetical protein CPC08DRAFT_636812 [Agrocybe pediades]|nr:hypothetical protein CPC08DRAFT_636812 [Agrocybe pediades]